MIKKECLIKYMLVIFALVASFPMFAHDIEVKNADGMIIYYSWINDRTELAVTYRGDNWSDGRCCYSGIVVIPESVKYEGNTYSVTCIGSGAFFGDGLTSVTIPNSVTTIYSSAFMDCMELRSVTIPNSVTYIEDGAFMGCDNLTSIISEIKNPFKIGGAFGASLATLTVPAGTKSLYQNTAGWNKFQNIVEAREGGEIGQVFESDGIYYIIGENNTVSVTEGNTIYSGALVIPNQVTYLGTTYSVTSIGYEAFMGCKGLISITIPNSVTSIEDQAFMGCKGLISITIPNSVTSIGNFAFSGCSGLTSVHITDLEAWCKILFGDYGEYESNPLYNAHHLYMNGSEITNLVIPNSVTSIGSDAFRECSGLTSITIPNSVTSIGSYAFFGTGWYNNQPDGLVYAGKVAYKYKGTMPDNTSLIIQDSTVGIARSAFWGCSGLTSITIPNSVTNIGSYAFCDCSGLTSITIPNSVTSIGSYAFYDCSGLTSLTIPNSVTSLGGSAFSGCSGLTTVTIPNSVTSIEGSAFSGCRGLTTIVSEIEKPFEIYSYTFSDDTYIVAELIVPYGTKAAYQTTEGWNKFTMITEAANKDGALFTIDGTTYEGTKSSKSVEVKSVDKSKASLEIPAVVSSDGTTYTVTGITDNVFNGCNMAALIWDVESALPNDAFSNASIGSNFLLYVKSSNYAPSSVKNVVVNGTASSIQLADDGGQFYCPQAFTARTISYTHNYSMETGGNGKGWETIALPFYVQKISHSTRGVIVPFALYSSSSSQKPFWLARFSGSEFKRTSAIEANEPYIIAMPNNSKYRKEYNLAGDVTFSAENAAVPQTPAFNGKFQPSFASAAKSDVIMALNNSRYSGGYDPGSRFIRGLRDIHPFEAYMTGSSSTRGVIEINLNDDTTDLDDILLSADEDNEVTVHALSGQQVVHTTQRDFDQLWNNLPEGAYIVNGKKMIK